MKPLKGKIAVVTGASRGVGRGIAVVLGECAATVYVTGRSRRGGSASADVPGTIDDTADEVSRRGGIGIAVPCDHRDSNQVEALFARIRVEQGRLDLLINNAWGGYEGHRGGLRPRNFWEAPLSLWDGMIEGGLRTHLLATYFGIPLMLARKSGLIVSTIAWDHDKYLGSFYDVAKHSIARLIWGLARELSPHGVATVALAPGFTRTERVLQAFNTTEDKWREMPGLKKTESPEYAGRAVAALAQDKRVRRRSGKAYMTGELAREYGFTDVDGRRPAPFHIPSFEKILAQISKPGKPSKPKQGKSAAAS
jgi:NAD(P)-dependent dehydrogenase (short-subunit alcohol dehydrogenase family)